VACVADPLSVALAYGATFLVEAEASS